MRCLALADQLAREGARVRFLSAAMPEALSARITSSGHALSFLASPPAHDRERSDWHWPPLDSDAQRRDAGATEAASGAVDWVVVDHYLLDRRWHSAARRFAKRVLVIDDLASRACDCDLLVDQTLGRSASDYGDLVPEPARILAGPQYALLRPEFERERAAALERRRRPDPPGRIIVSLGTTDPNSMTGTLVEALLEAATDHAIDVVMTGEAASLGAVQELAKRHSRLTVHIDTDRMAELMRDADLAIGAAGTSSWERCSLGLPAIALLLAENQRPSADALERAGAIVKMEDVAEVGAALAGILDNVPRLQQMSAAAFAITDGKGAGRILRAMAGPTAAEAHSGAIELRRAAREDSEALWLWRNDPVTRANSRTAEPIGWTDHVRWLSVVLADPHRDLLIAERGGCPVGTVRFDRLGGKRKSVEVSINVRPDMRGEGLGRAILRSACECLAVRHGPSEVRASVRADNQRSRRLFESCGFRCAGAEGEWVLYALAGQQQSAGSGRKLA